MFGFEMGQKPPSLVIVCDEPEIVYANYLIQLISQKDDDGDSIVGVVDNSLIAAIYSFKHYKDTLPKIPSNVRIIFIGQAAQEQRGTIPNKFNKLRMRYGWLGTRAVLCGE